MPARPTTDLVVERRAALPTIRYPAELPVSQRRDEIAEAVERHQVVIVAGETGSGKTTQLPKICLDLGRGIEATIGHTQPRRLAARTVAARIAEELGTEVGDVVGYAVRFTDRVGDLTLVKLMTDGILLNEIHRDRMLRAYDTVIVDEAHERSLNIDFILGYLVRLLPRRPDLKVIVTSATIDADRFSSHFGGAPVIEVTGRTHPVEVRYQPLDDGSTRGRDQIAAICDAVEELWTEPAGDILVFLSGEREIRDTARALVDLGLPDTEIVPLYARLPTAEQQRVFAPHRGRRVVLATNVAETSLTVPGIRFVVDPGTARVSRYSHRLKVQRLPIEPVSRASADQRAGRCGRVAPGICIRLYDEDDYASRPEFTEPEILRTNLASVILQMAALDLGDVAAFPFLDPPDPRAVTDGMRLLGELGAIEPPDRRRDPSGPGRLTAVGRTLARLPLDPRFGRMVIEAHETGCLREVLVIAAALSIEDPRERPSENAGAADELHRRFADPSSDFLAHLALWRYVRDQQRELSGNQFRKLCRTEHLNFLRIREWQDVHSQLRRLAGQLGLQTGGRSGSGTDGDAHPDLVHRALLSGLLSHIGHREGDTREYRGARGARFAVFPGSSLAKKPPAWVMAAELVETSRLWGRTVARIQPEWAEQLAPHLVKRSVTEPHWSEERGSAMAYESVTLYGLPLVTRRLVGYASVDPAVARELFIHHALVLGEWPAHHRFIGRNREVLAEVEELEHRFRRSDLVVDDEALFRLYDERVGRGVVSARHFDSWWKEARRRDPDLLTFRVDDLLRTDADDLDEHAFPATWRHGDLELGISYVFDPGSPDDGAAVHIPVSVLNQIRPEPFEWQVPGLRQERVEALIRSLPKDLRRRFVPIPDHARSVLDAVGAGDTAATPDEPLLDVLGRVLSAGGAPIPRSAWDRSKVPDHLSIAFVVEDADGAVLAQGRDLGALSAELAPAVRASLAGASPSLETTGCRSWTFGEIPRRVELGAAGGVVVGYPSLVDEGDTVGLHVLDRRAAQTDAMWDGTRRLLRLGIPVPTRTIQRRLTDTAQLGLTTNPYESTNALASACVTAALDQLMDRHGAPAWDADAFDRLRAAVADEVDAAATEVGRLVARILTTVAVLDQALVRPAAAALAPALADIAGQRTALVYPGFVTELGASRLPDVLRYLRAAVHRIDALPAAPGRDADRMAQVHRVETAYAVLADALPHDGPTGIELERLGWLIEELRVSLFAQQLGTPEPVSEKRLMRALARLGGG